MSQLISRRVMIFVENLYQELELWYPLLRLKEEGIETKLVGSGSSERPQCSDLR
ncbi:MAG: hypothetical protein NTX88_01195 [Candidatus Atribacteria bacterium]|nr:hypothetical protein [Candidatus Atribacteria bacterium]